MPVITSRPLEGRPLEQDGELTGITRGAISRVANTSQDGTHVILDKVPGTDWGLAGVPFADQDPR